MTAKKAVAKRAKVTDVSESGKILAIVSQAAANPETDPEKIERLLNLYERVAEKNAEAEYNKAFAEMQVNLPVISEKGEIKVKGQLRSKYAKFEDINEVVKPILGEHGFGVSFRIDAAEGEIGVTAILAHKAGHREETRIPLPFDNSGSKNDVQARGSTVSYGKRYTLCAILNISTGGEDDDGAGAYPRISEAQATIIRKLIEKSGKDEKAFLSWANVASVEDIHENAFKKTKEVLEAAVERNGNS